MLSETELFLVHCQIVRCAMKKYPKNNVELFF